MKTSSFSFWNKKAIFNDIPDSSINGLHKDLHSYLPKIDNSDHKKEMTCLLKNPPQRIAFQP